MSMNDVTIQGEQFFLVPLEFLSKVEDIFYKEYAFKKHDIFMKLFQIAEAMDKRGWFHLETKKGKQLARAFSKSELNFIKEYYNKAINNKDLPF